MNDQPEKAKIATGVALQALGMTATLAEGEDRPESEVFNDLLNSCENMQSMLKPLLSEMVQAKAKEDMDALVQAHRNLFLMCDAVAVTAVTMVTHFPGFTEQLLTPEIRAVWQLDTLKS